MGDVCSVWTHRGGLGALFFFESHDLPWAPRDASQDLEEPRGASRAFRDIAQLSLARFRSASRGLCGGPTKSRGVFSSLARCRKASRGVGASLAWPQCMKPRARSVRAPHSYHRPPEPLAAHSRGRPRRCSGLLGLRRQDGLRRCHGLRAMAIPWEGGNTLGGGGPQGCGDPMGCGDPRGVGDTMGDGEPMCCRDTTDCGDHDGCGDIIGCGAPKGCSDPMGCGATLRPGDPMGCGATLRHGDPMGDPASGVALTHGLRRQFRRASRSKQQRPDECEDMLRRCSLGLRSLPVKVVTPALRRHRRVPQKPCVQGAVRG